MEKKQKKVTKKPVINKKKEIKTKLTKFDIEGKLIHISVGDNIKPATDKDIQEIEKKIQDIVPDEVNCIVFVTHHGVKITVL